MLTKLTTCICLGNSFNHLVSNSEKCWSLDSIPDSGVRQETRSMVALTYKFQIAYTFICATSCTLTTFLPLAYEEKRLPLLKYSHIDDSLYVYVYAVKVLAAPVIFVCITTVDTMYVGLCVTVTAQLKATFGVLENKDMSNTRDADLSYIINHHNLLLRYVFFSTTGVFD